MINKSKAEKNRVQEMLDTIHMPEDAGEWHDGILAIMNRILTM
jgi:hypothetical protein